MLCVGGGCLGVGVAAQLAVASRPGNCRVGQPAAAERRRRRRLLLDRLTARPAAPGAAAAGRTPQLRVRRQVKAGRPPLLGHQPGRSPGAAWMAHCRWTRLQYAAAAQQGEKQKLGQHGVRPERHGAGSAVSARCLQASNCHELARGTSAGSPARAAAAEWQHPAAWEPSRTTPSRRACRRSIAGTGAGSCAAAAAAAAAAAGGVTPLPSHDRAPLLLAAANRSYWWAILASASRACCCGSPPAALKRCGGAGQLAWGRPPPLPLPPRTRSAHTPMRTLPRSAAGAHDRRGLQGQGGAAGRQDGGEWGGGAARGCVPCQTCCAPPSQQTRPLLALLACS